MNKSLKVLSLAVLSGVVAVSLTACGKKAPPKPKAEASAVVQAAGSIVQISKDELQSAQWTQLKEKKDEVVYYRASDVGSKNGVWLKSVENKDNETEYKYYTTDCSGKNAVVKTAEIDVKKNGELKREAENDPVKDVAKADAIRALICGK